MNESLALWLKLREPADQASRSTELTEAIVATMPVDEPVHVLDLATGAGSNLRYLMERLPPRQRWLVVDHSPLLLAALLERTAEWAVGRGYAVRHHGLACTISGAQLECDIETEQRDLGTLEDDRLFAGRHLVTASALLDLVSEAWLRSLALHCREARAAVLFAMSYNGWSTCLPIEPEDALVRRLMNAHQGRDKGLGGLAQGPAASACVERCFADAGYRVRSASSDWMLGPDTPELQRQLIDGWAEAATETDPSLADMIADWRARRCALVSAGRSRIMVGHHDLAAWSAG